MSSRIRIGGDIIFLTILAFIFWPWGVFVVDAIAWAFTGGPFSKVPWFSIRGLVLALWPAALAYLLIKFTSKL